MNHCTFSLLAADDPPPVSVQNAAGASPLLLVADHAGIASPRALGRLGVAESEWQRHIAWDIGIAALAPAFRCARCDAHPAELFAAGDRLQPAA